MASALDQFNSDGQVIDAFNGSEATSAVDYEDYYTNPGLMPTTDFSTYYNNVKGLYGLDWIKNPYSLLGKITNFFTGDISKIEDAYNSYMAKGANLYNATREKNDTRYQQALADTAVQRKANDYEAAGFNRMLAAGASGASSAAAVGSSLDSLGSGKGKNGSTSGDDFFGGLLKMLLAGLRVGSQLGAAETRASSAIDVMKGYTEAYKR